MTKEETMDAGALRRALADLLMDWRADIPTAVGYTYQDRMRWAADRLLAAAREPVAPAEAETPDERHRRWDEAHAFGFREGHRLALAQPPAPASADTPEAIEADAGQMLVRAFHLRVNRGDPGDAHEMRHLRACVEIGNSDDCEGGANCTLDRAAIRGTTPLDAVLVPLDWTKQELLGIRNREYDDERWLSLDDIAALRGQPSEPAS